MLVNQELNRAEPIKPPIGDPVDRITAERREAAARGFQGGLKIYDISDRTRPRPIGLYPSYGVHRFDSDDRYAYISSEEEGHFMPTPANGFPVQSNDVFFEKRRGLIYVIDRFSGLDILEYRH